MRWVLLIFLLLTTALSIWCIPFAFTFGWVLMGLAGGILIPIALTVAYIGFIGPLWRKVWHLFPDPAELENQSSEETSQ